MFIEALIPREDLLALVAEALPLTLHLGDPEAHHSLGLSDLSEVQLVAELGLRMACKARLHWPLLGIDAPLLLNAINVMLIPEVRPTPTGEVLAFRLTLEHLDVAGLPEFVDGTLVHKINEKLAAKHVELSWDFSKTLGRMIDLPELLEPLDGLAMRAAWGKVRITEEAFVFALSLHTAVVRHGEEPRREFAANPASASAAPPAPPRPNVSRALTKHAGVPAEALATAAVFGLAAGAVFFGLRSLVSRK